jgi:hypothetical protein
MGRKFFVPARTLIAVKLLITMYLGRDPISAAPRCIHREFLERWRLDARRGAPVKVFVKGLRVMVVLLFIMVHRPRRQPKFVFLMTYIMVKYDT